MADYTNEALLIFVKNPEKGKVKTRLAKSIGDEQALSIYKKLLHITKSATDPLDICRQVWYSQSIEKSDLWSEDGYEKKRQKGRNLGRRMRHAFRQAFEDGFEKVVIIGSDCAELNSEILEQAFDLLNKHRVVMGPSRDGGYYLLGMKDFYPELFEEKKWSTPSVCEQTIQQLETKNISYQLMPTLNDIDTEADLKQSNRLSL